MIKGLERRARYPRLGVIRLGIKVQRNGKEYPQEVEHFVLPADLAALLGDERPTALSVMFPSSNLEEILPNAYIRYQGKLKTVDCDGETARLWTPEGQRTEQACRKEPYHDCACLAKALGRLQVIVVHPEAPIGIWQVLIGGEQRLADLLADLKLYLGILRGHLTGTVFRLVREPATVQIQTADGKRLARTGYPVRLKSDLSIMDALAARGVKALPGMTDGQVRAIAAASEEIDVDDADFVEGETTSPPACPPPEGVRGTRITEQPQRPDVHPVVQSPAPASPRAAESRERPPAQTPSASVTAGAGSPSAATNLPPAAVATTVAGKPVDTATGEILDLVEVRKECVNLALSLPARKGKPPMTRGMAETIFSDLDAHKLADYLMLLRGSIKDPALRAQTQSAMGLQWKWYHEKRGLPVPATAS